MPGNTGRYSCPEGRAAAARPVVTGLAAADRFSYTLPANNALSQFCPGNPFPAGTTPPFPPGAYADGVYIMLAPLSAGVHHISFAAQAEGGPLGNGTQNVTYTITVPA